MAEKDITKDIAEAKLLASELHGLLHEDALQRLQLYKNYSNKFDDMKWTPSLYQRCQLVDALCKKLNVLYQ